MTTNLPKIAFWLLVFSILRSFFFLYLFLEIEIAIISVGKQHCREEINRVTQNHKKGMNFYFGKLVTRYEKIALGDFWGSMGPLLEPLGIN